MTTQDVIRRYMTVPNQRYWNREPRRKYYTGLANGLAKSLLGHDEICQSELSQ